MGQYGPVIVVTQVERKIWQKIKNSEEERKRVSEELERRIDELSLRLKLLEEVDEQGELFSGMILPRRVPPFFIPFSYWKDMPFSIPASSISTTFYTGSYGKGMRL